MKITDREDRDMTVFLLGFFFCFAYISFFFIIVITSNGSNFLEQEIHRQVLSNDIYENQEHYNIYFNDLDYNKSIEEFQKVIKTSYDNLDIKNPCQFYSAVWVKYLQINDIKYKTFSTDNHIFVIAYTEDYYIVLDQWIIDYVYFENSNYE